MSARDEMVRNCAILMKAAAEMKVPTVVSEQYPEGLGRTLPELHELARAEDLFSKLEFSCVRNERLRKQLSRDGRDQTIIAGIEAHVCVLQSALDLSDGKGSVFVAADAIASRRPESKEFALRRMSNAGITTVTTEMVVFEWLRTASSPSFKALSKLIR